MNVLRGVRKHLAEQQSWLRTLCNVGVALFVVLGVMTLSGCPGEPVIVEFAAKPATVSNAQSSTLTWAVHNAASLSIDNGIGTVTGNSVTVEPKATTTYTLTARNQMGVATATATVKLCAGLGCGSPADAVTVSRHINVDQFGYRPSATKVAVLSDPLVGYNADESYAPGGPGSMQVRAWADGTVVLSGAPVVWNNGQAQDSSGDRGWWFDFSLVKGPGTYYVYDVVNNVRSVGFDIREDVYSDVLKAAIRMFYYNRCGTPKLATNAGSCWVDETSYMSEGQDTEARNYRTPDDPASARDVSGGWFDAGDTNKYVINSNDPVHGMLLAYQKRPSIWSDDTNIPESGNGIPDVLDEVKWEMDWLKKMQNPDGSAMLKVGTLARSEASPPSADKTRRYYVPACSSATISVAGTYAHAALVFKNFPTFASYADGLRAQAELAWVKYQSQSVKDEQCDDGSVQSGVTDRTTAEQNGYAVVAAVYLYALTHNEIYNEYVRANYTAAQPFRDDAWRLNNPNDADALLYYTTLPGADATTVAAIIGRKAADANAHDAIYQFAENDDLYRAYMDDALYHWGSNYKHAGVGWANLEAATYQVNPEKTANYELRAEEVLHYFHGVNPINMVYLSNMQNYGAEFSANEIFHYWFFDGTKWDSSLPPLAEGQCGPAPGFVPGGPSATYPSCGPDETPVSPPAGQPRQKAYRDWNADWPEASFEITEPSIAYQAIYLKLLSGFVGR